LPGQPNAHLWTAYAAATHPAQLHGARLHNMGHYPMLIETAGAGTVRGLLLSIEAPRQRVVTRLLDQLERYDPARPAAGLYRRRARMVQPADGEAISAWVYVGRPDVAAPYPLVPNGDWAAFSRSRQREMARWWRDHGADYDQALRPDNRP
jgi:gamma-glutamylcyclotransferase (GGCT)/AIG2-like uncharacterized protein YtfP